MPVVMVNNRKLKLTNLDKILWPEKEITKGEFLSYVSRMAPFMLKYLKDRPMVFTRYPDGIYGKSFYQKNCPSYAPEWIKTIGIKSEKRIIKYVLINDVETLLWTANQASIEMHPWHSRIQALDYPDYVVFDLDPMENTNFEDAVQLALQLKKALNMEGIRGYAKTSGATGLQVYVPLEKKYTYEEVREFARIFSQAVAEANCEIATVERMVDKRQGKLYMDYLQNIKGKTIIAPYSLRARQGATVSAPVTWEELERGINPEDFNIKTMAARMQTMGDVFEKVLTDKQNIDHVLKNSN